MIQALKTGALSNAIRTIRAAWTTHDLRRTARTLMARAGVNEDHAERALGHVIGEVQGVYNKYEYRDEKRVAFETLASQIERILNPPIKNVVPLQRVR